MAWLHAESNPFWQALVKLLVAAQESTIKSDVTVKITSENCRSDICQAEHTCIFVILR